MVALLICTPIVFDCYISLAPPPFQDLEGKGVFNEFCASVKMFGSELKQGVDLIMVLWLKQSEIQIFWMEYQIMVV
jgi:hypothetical protein